MTVRERFAGVWTAVSAALVAGLIAVSAEAADRDAARAFLEVTGFDVAITSMQQDAMSGPGMSGQEASDFGSQYAALAEKVFDPDLMLERALDMMEAVIPDDLLAHGGEFYASELGQRLVVAENASQLTSTDTRYAEGQLIADALAEENPGRIEDYQAMMAAIGGIDGSIRAVLEIQLRYLMAAMSAGTLELNFSEDELRVLLAEQTPELRAQMEVSTVLISAYTYQSFSDEDIKAYRAALEETEMQQVYEILNAIQHEIMAERYEVLAERLAELMPQTDI